MRPPTDSTLALACRTYQLWNDGGPERLVEDIWPADVVFHEIPEMPDAGVYRGVDAVAARMRELVELAGHFQLSVRSLEARGDYVLAASEMTAQGAFSGLRLTQCIFHVLRCRGGRVQEIRAHFDSRRARFDFDRLCAGVA